MKRLILLCLIPVILCSVFLSVPVQANSNIAISGSFYRQNFQMVPGETLSTPDVYIVVFNHDEKAVDIQLVSQTPAEVEMFFSQKEFNIPGKGEIRVDVGLRISKTATPGDFVISVTALIKENGQGIVVSGGVQQQARLSILGEAGTINIKTCLVTGELFQSEIHLSRKSGGQLSSVGLSESGKLTMRLTPGDYFIQAFYKDVEVAKQDFSLAANEVKEIVLQARTIFVDGFSVLPQGQGEKIAFAKINYTPRNIYQPVKNLKAILIVKFNGKLLEETEINSFSTLDVGYMGYNYNYAPAQWQTGRYDFQLKIVSGDIVYAQSLEKQLEVKIPSAINWIMIIGIVVGVLLAAIAIAIAIIKRRKGGPQK